MHSKPVINSKSSLFLDFDGTLVPLSETPHSIHVPSFLVKLLADLHENLSGALAIVSGRQIKTLDYFLSPLKLPSAGVHGLQRRNAYGLIKEFNAPNYDSLLIECNKLMKIYPNLLLERKKISVALHYRRVPELEKLCIYTFQQAIRNRSELTLLLGKFVVEIIPKGFTKGTAILEYMQEPPFKGRVPIFVGDDITDESGFEAVHSYGGDAVKVGNSPTKAHHRFNSVDEIHQWLVFNCDSLNNKENN